MKKNSKTDRPSPYQSSVWVCEFGIRHGIHDACGCPERYGVWRYEFSRRMQELFHENGRPVFASDVTPWMRRTVIDSYRNSDTLDKRNLR